MSSHHMTKRAHCLATVAALALLPAAALAQSDAAGTGPVEESSETVESILVEGISLGQSRMALPVQVLSGAELAHRRLGTLGETLAGLPGVHLDNYGGGASRPVVRGQTLPRLEVLSNGANLYDVSSVSPDHAVAGDPLLLDAIEVVRGPASAIYGGSAMNGAINLIDGRVPRAMPENGLSGATEMRYSTGDEGLASAARATIGLGSSFALHIEGSTSDADDYAVPGDHGTDRLKDSFSQSSSYAIGASWITERGYIGAAYSRQDSDYGLPGHNHTNAVCHTHGRDLHCAAHGPYSDPFAGSDEDHTASIGLRNERIDVRADFENLMPGITHTHLRLSHTDYTHNEVDGEFLFAQYGNEVEDARLEMVHAPLFGFTGTFGVHYMNGTFSGLNHNSAHEPEPDLGWVYPADYTTESVGIFMAQRRSFGDVELEIAARKDWREMGAELPRYNISDYYVGLLWDALGMTPEDWLELLTPEFWDVNPQSEHEPVSVSLGLTWDAGRGYSAALSLAHTQRAPGVRELYAYGNNLATNSYEVGLANTQRASSSFAESTTDITETAQTINLTLRKAGGPLEYEVGVYHQEIEDYVFAELIEVDSETGLPHLYLVYVAADATFTGIDGEVSYRFAPHSQLTVFGDYVRTELNGQDDNLPRIPPGRLGARYDWDAGALTGNVEYYHTFEQDRVASYETETAGYDMVNATVSYATELGGRPIELYARGTNLLDELAYVHTSFVKTQSPLRGRNVVFGIRHEF